MLYLLWLNDGPINSCLSKFKWRKKLRRVRSLENLYDQYRDRKFPISLLKRTQLSQVTADLQGSVTNLVRSCNKLIIPRLLIGLNAAKIAQNRRK